MTNIISENNQEVNNIIAKNYVEVSADFSQEEEFDSFLTKSAANQFNGAMCIKSFDSVFPKLKTYNVLRDFCMHMIVNTSHIDLPETSGFIMSTPSAGGGANQTPPMVPITVSDEYAKWLIPRTLFKQANIAEYVKNIVASEIASLERAIFVKGKKNVFDGVVQKLYYNTRHVNFNVITYDGTGKDITKDEVNDKNLLNICKDLIKKVDAKYRKDAVFIVGNSIFDLMMCSWNNTASTYDWVNTTFLGYKVIVVSELENTILFGDFKQGVVFVEREGSKFDIRVDNDPRYIALSLPMSFGFGVINKDAIAVAGPSSKPSSLDQLA